MWYIVEYLGKIEIRKEKLKSPIILSLSIL